MEMKSPIAPVLIHTRRGDQVKSVTIAGEHANVVVTDFLFCLAGPRLC
jgi:hypothetical protein